MKPLFITVICTAIIAAQALVAQNFQWEHSNGPDTVVHKFTIHNDILFVATEKGIYQTTDNSNSWLQLVISNDTLVNTPVTAIYSHDGFLWAGIRKRPGIKTLYNSSDNGNSWIGIQNFGGTDVYCFSSGLSHLFVGCTNGIARTSNLGKTWRQGLSDKTYTICVANSFIFSGVNGFVTVSKDTGKTTFAVNPPIPQAPVGALYHLGDSTLLAGVSYNDGVYLTTNYGATWRSYSVGMTGSVAVSVYCFHAVGEYLFAGSSEGMYYSTNSGAKWQQINDGLTVPGDTVWCVQAYGDYLYAGTNHGVFRAKLPAVGVEEQPQVLGISIAPNPVSEFFTVHCPDAVTSITVRDVFGRSIYQASDITGTEVSISTESYVSGVYFVEVAIRGNSRSIQKLVVSH